MYLSVIPRVYSGPLTFAVGHIEGYPTMSISRMGVQRAATSFPADMASNMPHMRNELRPRC